MMRKPYIHTRPADATLEEVLDGLGKKQKTLPPKLFYDERGSQLFDAICDCDEYYVTRTEMKLTNRYVRDIVRAIGPDAALIEFGSGSSMKTRLLLDNIQRPAVYMPIDISESHLFASAERLRRAYPHLRVDPVHADYTRDLSLPVLPAHARKVAYFPGSTIGNFLPLDAAAFMDRIASMVGPGGGLLIGVDLKKDAARLHAAYNDARGITAAFNLNILAHINRRWDANFDLSQWKHHAFYNERRGCIEMHLVSARDQEIDIEGYRFIFKKDETILTEYSYKYSVEEFHQLADDAFRPQRVWIDPDRLFSLHYMTAI